MFHVLYLSTATCQELIEKLANLFNASPSVIVDIHLLGSNKIHIMVTDEVVQNMPDGAQYSVEVLKSEYDSSLLAHLLLYEVPAGVSQIQQAGPVQPYTNQ